ncbi:MAG TPA: HNH endonuclease signature motif containing protein [Candidatus Krumholzibacteria bacterium]|nr:HNH endonuclease signature motif containing protein [Candidatus Krumholzibacteria bacterium]
MFLRSISDVALLNRIKRLTRCERSFTLRVLACLNEIESRKLHFAFGYSSLFNFCTSGLGYSGSAAGRRIATARTMARFPEIWALLRDNDVNVCTVSRVSRVLTPDNKDEILARIRRKSLDEVVAIAAEYLPPSAAVRDRVRDVVVSTPRGPLLDGVRPVTSGVASLSFSGDDRPGDQSSGRNESLTFAPGGSNDGASPPAADAGSHTMEQSPTDAGLSPGAGDLERRIVLRFGVSSEFMTKLERVRALAWHRLPANATLEHVFELVIDDTLKRTDPVLRRERRSRRERAPHQDATSPVTPGERTGAAPERDPRQIPRRVRDDVFARDQGRCTFVGPDGRRCEATRALQIDHILPVARGGGAAIENLRLLCAQHNRLVAERLFGPQAHSHSGSDCKDPAPRGSTAGQVSNSRDDAAMRDPGMPAPRGSTAGQAGIGGDTGVPDP